MHTRLSLPLVADEACRFSHSIPASPPVPHNEISVMAPDPRASKLKKANKRRKNRTEKHSEAVLSDVTSLQHPTLGGHLADPETTSSRSGSANSYPSPTTTHLMACICSSVGILQEPGPGSFSKKGKPAPTVADACSREGQ